MVEQPESGYTDIHLLLADLRGALETLYGDRLVLYDSHVRRARDRARLKEAAEKTRKADENERRRTRGRAALFGG